MNASPTTYLLPCSCGRENPVETRQAGGSVRCECGRTCTVPTMREVLALRRAPDSAGEAASIRPVWGNPQRLLVAGLIILLLAAAGALIVYLQFPTHFRGVPTPEAVRQHVKRLTPAETIVFFRSNILPGLEAPQEGPVQAARSKVYIGLAALGGLGGVGLILTGAGVAGMVRRRRSLLRPSA